jgi:hypothetical protein
MSTERPIIFVGGVHRSGTTLYADLLAHHSRLGGIENAGVGANEGQYTQDVLPLEDAFHGPGRFAFYPGYREASLGPVPAEAAQRLRAAWDAYWPESAEFVIEKTPGNLLRALTLRDLFPGARFIFLIRHPIAVSLATQKWSHTGVFSLIQHWLTAYQYLHTLEAAGLPYQLVSYEEFLARPRAVVDASFSFIGVEPEATRLPTLNNANVQYFERWQSYFSRGNRLENFTSKTLATGRASAPARAMHGLLRRIKSLKDTALSFGFQVTLAEREAQDAAQFYEPAVNAFGYSLSDFARYPCGYTFAPAVGRVSAPGRG